MGPGEEKNNKIKVREEVFSILIKDSEHVLYW